MSMKRDIKLVVDCGYGSTGKGAIIGKLASDWQPDTAITAFAPSAGHTTVTKTGFKYVHLQLANSIISPRLKQVLIGPGSAINPEILLKEITEAKHHGYLVNVEVLIHENAAAVTEENIKSEGEFVRIGSTRKGGGAANIQRIKRDPLNMNIAKVAMPAGPWKVVSVEDYNRAVDKGRRIIIEGCQGYGLSAYHGQYPYCTYRDITTAQHIADSGVPLSWKFGTLSVIGTIRTYNIRVANRFDEQGNQIGYSGPFPDDSEEITFDKINQAVEMTTVTKLPRRIATFSKKQAAEAIRQNGVGSLFLNFANYSQSEKELMDLVKYLNKLTHVQYIGFGPAEQDILDVGDLHETEANKAIVEMYHKYKGDK